MEASGIPIGLWEVVGVAACLVGSAFFSGSETALTHISSTRAEHLLEAEPGKWGILSIWLDNRKRILSALLVGNNLVNILASILTYRIAARIVPGYAEAISVLGLTLVILVFAEITPKSLAMQHAERVAVSVLRVIWLIDKLLWPLAWPLSRIPGLIGRPGAIEAEPVVTEDEIEFHIRRGVDRDVFEHDEQGELLMSAVEFSEIMVKEVMVPRTDIFGLEKNTPVDEAVERVIERGHSRIPVYENNLDRVIGLLYAKDLLRHIHRARDVEDTGIAGTVRENLLFVPETQKISVLLADMRRLGLHMAMVVDEFGGTAGLVTLEDLIEELVGEIRDEFDPDEAMIAQLGDDRWSVDARLSLMDFEDETGIELPDTGDYESVGGFVVHRWGRIPRKGRVVQLKGLEVVVLDSDPRHVKRVEIRRLPESEDREDEEDGTSE
ncbi:MAG: hemolysin family protein [Polyangia bacterium]